jgi:hypothetical protein
MEYVVPACRCVLGVVFLVASFGKLRRRSAFTEFVAAVERMVPAFARFRLLLAVVVIVNETAVALTMVSARTALFGFVLAILMLSAFVTGIAISIRRGARSRCRCFGTSDVPLGLRHIVRNIALIALAAVGLIGVTVPTEHLPAQAGVLLSVAAGMVLGTLFIRFDDVVDVFSTSI